MKHVLYGGKSILMDDQSADLLLEYAAAIPPDESGDTVDITAVSPDGNTVEVTFLLNSNTELVAETTHSEMVPPSNETAVAYMQERLDALRHPPAAQPEAGDGDFLQPPEDI
ncbi:hypothetical protein [Agromyces sp. NPDC058110]|uniref:hypothetical protein n=1 Tax=Agromyces sp. NPDC058110 TaxID=3346345 RepID=UPI0036D9690C